MSIQVAEIINMKMRYLMVSKKRIFYSCEDGIETPVARDHRVSSLSKPHDAKQRFSRRIFLINPHAHDRFL